jgi:hypothetical protein
MVSKYIDKDGISNLIMLCLVCHKIVDELERKFTVERVREWKTTHEQKIRGLFDIPHITDERELLIQVNELLDENEQIFREYGPFAVRTLEGASGDSLKIWRKRCLDTILPNNQKIIDIIERNKHNFPYPWDVYRKMLGYKLHADAFRDNCLRGQKVNDYRLFPVEFDHFVKETLGLSIPPLEVKIEEELEFRTTTVSRFIERFLANHSFIVHMEKLDIATFLVELKDGRTLRVFVTNTYYFTEYTFDKAMAIDPEIDVIICSCPAATYSEQAKFLCIENQIGLFMLNEFMGAIPKRDEEFLNYLLRADKEHRINTFSNSLQKFSIPNGVIVYLFGSFLRSKVYRDIDVMLVYKDEHSRQGIEQTKRAISSALQSEANKLEFTVCSSAEFATLRFDHNNLTRIATPL